MKSKSMEQYWNQIIHAWEDSSYKDGRSAPLLEKIAGKFRTHIVDRHNTCVESVRKFVAGKTIVEVGCASGTLCFELLKLNAKKVIGLDIAEEAIKRAQLSAKVGNVTEERASFFKYTIGDKLPINTKPDLLCGLGITEYVVPEDLAKLMTELKPEYFFISFDEKVVNFQKIIHFGYRTWKQIPYYKMYSQKEMKELMESCGYKNVRTFRDKQNAFVTNLAP